MVRWLGIVLGTLRSAVHTHRELALENLALRQQLAVWKARELRPRLTETGSSGFCYRGCGRVAAFAAGGAAGDGGWLAPAGISTVLGVEESAPIRSAHGQYRAPRSDSPGELRQSSLGCAKASRPRSLESDIQS